MTRLAEATTPEDKSHFRSSLIVGTLGTVLLLTAYVVLFAISVFPSIPSSLGGGRFPVVRFLLKPVASGDGMQPSPTTSPTTRSGAAEPYLTPDTLDGRYSAEQNLFLTTSDDYVVYSHERDGAVFFSRSLVDGYVIERPK